MRHSLVPHYEYAVQRLNNRLRLVTVQVPNAVSAAIGVWVNVGSRYETDEIAGISHFLEHLVFKGTRTRTCEQLKNAVEGSGGTLNAFTTEEHTCYYAKTLGSQAATALDVLLDMVINPVLSPKDITTERNVILEEIRMYHDQPSHHVHDLISGQLWPSHTLGRPITGSLESVTRITRAELQSYRRQEYIPAHLTVACVGRVDVDACGVEAHRQRGMSPSM